MKLDSKLEAALIEFLRRLADAEASKASGMHRIAKALEKIADKRSLDDEITLATLGADCED